MPKTEPDETPKKNAGAKKPAASMTDVAKPGKTSPDTSARPIIVSSRPMVQDPMVNKDTKTDGVQGVPAVNKKDASLKDLLKSGRKRLVIQPSDGEELDKTSETPKPGETINADGEEAAKTSSEAPESVDFKDLLVDGKPKSDQTEAAAKTAVKPELKIAVSESSSKEIEASKETAEAKPTEDTKDTDPPKEETPEKTEDPKDDANKKESEAPAAEKPKDSVVQEPEGGLVDELAKQTADKKKQVEQDKQLAVKQEKFDKLIEDKTYFVKTATISKRRARNAILGVVLLLIVAVVGLNFAADAKLINIGVEPPTNLIPDQNTTTATPQAPAGAEAKTKTYTDSTKTFTIDYPETWKLVEVDSNAHSKEKIDYTKSSKRVELRPPNEEIQEIVVDVGGIKKTSFPVEEAFKGAKLTEDEFTKSTRKSINGYDVIYTKIDFVGPSDVEAYTNHSYEIFGPDGKYAYLTFREKYRHDTNEEANPGNVNYDASKYLDEFEQIVNSVKFTE